MEYRRQAENLWKKLELARGVYFANDERAELKSKINKILKSNIIEIKQYDNYKIWMKNKLVQY